LELKDTKGLEEKRESFLLSELRDLSNELSSNPMLVAVCEVFYVAIFFFAYAVALILPFPTAFLDAWKHYIERKDG
jgi:hypothetical protein